MNTYSSNLQKLERQRRQLEKLWQPTPAEKIKQASSQLLRTAGQWLVHTFAEGDQLRIWTQTSKQGDLWCVHDPVAGAKHQFASEEALRTWIEQRYYND
ncbi:MAG: hypothetical protein ACFB2W_19945 [Leptolyngbyaceae cyanobacterium]